MVRPTMEEVSATGRGVYSSPLTQANASTNRIASRGSDSEGESSRHRAGPRSLSTSARYCRRCRRRQGLEDATPAREFFEEFGKERAQAIPLVPQKSDPSSFTSQSQR